MASSDTIVVNGVPSGSFVINRDSAVANKEIIDAMYKNKKKMKKYNYGGQTNPMNENIVVGDGEALMDNSMVNQYGLGVMQMLNQKPTAHESIDGLIASAQLSNMQNFKGGGYVSGAGNMMRETGMPTMGYKRGGYVPKMGNMMRESNMPTMGYNDGGYVNEYEDGGMTNNLKKVPSDNPGLGKLPKMVRNKMGYMQDGGMTDDPLNIGARMSMGNQGQNMGMISGEFGAQNIPPAWMQPAMPEIQSPQQAAAFQDMINKLMVEEALKKAREAGEQVQPERIEMSNEAYSLQDLIPQMNQEMSNMMQLPLYRANNMSNLGRGMIDR